MRKIQLTITSLLMAFGLLVVPLTVTTVDAGAAPTCTTPKQCISDGADIPTGTGNRNLGQQIKIVVNVLLFVLGAISVIMIVIGGIRYTLSNGDTAAVTSAKNTILYAVIGLVVALLAYAIVNFVLNAFS